MINANWNDAWVGSERSFTVRPNTQRYTHTRTTTHRRENVRGPYRSCWTHECVWTLRATVVAQSIRGSCETWAIDWFSMCCRDSMIHKDSVDWAHSCLRLLLGIELCVLCVSMKSKSRRVTQIGGHWIPLCVIFGVSEFHVKWSNSALSEKCKFLSIWRRQINSSPMFVYIYLLMRIPWNHMDVRNSCLIAMTDDSALSSGGGGGSTFELQTEN